MQKNSKTIDDLSNSGPAIRLLNEDTATRLPVACSGEIIMKFFVSAHLPDDFDPSTMDEQVGRNIHAFNAELEAAGALFFACGLGAAKTVSAQPSGEVLVTDGPYLETKEHIGGFLIIEAANLDEALAWARKGAVAAGGTVEVRPIFFNED